MSPRRSAFLDIGTNTVLCLIAEIRDTGRFRVLDDLAEITRLGEGVDQKRRISPAGEERTLAALRSYRARCDSLGVTEFLAVGTSALRDAENSADVCERLRDALGFEVRVIPGAEEAAYSFLAVQRGLSLADQSLLVIDIGGGSTELIAGKQSRGSRLDIAFDAGHLSGKKQGVAAPPLQSGPQVLRCVDKRVAMQASQPYELGIAQSGKQRKHPTLLAVGHLGLKTDQIVKRSLAVFLTELHDRVGPATRAWIDQAHRAHWTECESFTAPIGHFFDRHASFESDKTLEAMGRDALSAEQSIDECAVLLARQRQVQVIVAAFAVARRAIRNVHVDGLGRNDRRDRVVEIQVLLPQLPRKIGGKRR